MGNAEHLTRRVWLCLAAVFSTSSPLTSQHCHLHASTARWPNSSTGKSHVLFRSTHPSDRWLGQGKGGEKNHCLVPHPLTTQNGNHCELLYEHMDDLFEIERRKVLQFPEALLLSCFSLSTVYYVGTKKDLLWGIPRATGEHSRAIRPWTPLELVLQYSLQHFFSGHLLISCRSSAHRAQVKAH